MLTHLTLKILRKSLRHDPLSGDDAGCFFNLEHTAFG
jgi:hypothetical protein